MLTPDHLPPDDDLVGFVRDWLDLAGHGELEAACALLDGPSEGAVAWTPDMIRQHVAQLFGPDTHFGYEHPEGAVFTPASEAAGKPHAEVVALTDGSGYLVDHDVPLNGSFSDLTAQFEFLWVDGALRCSLHDLHVL